MTRAIEVFFMLGDEGQELYRDEGVSAARIPDSRTRWEAIWSHRDALVELAHSHPVGPLAFSEEDRTTMQALDSALGKPLVFSVVAPEGMIRRQNGVDVRVEDEPAWANELRRASGMRERA